VPHCRDGESWEFRQIGMKMIVQSGRGIAIVPRA
jgi:hypothetical protein